MLDYLHFHSLDLIGAMKLFLELYQKSIKYYVDCVVIRFHLCIGIKVNFKEFNK